MNQLITDVSLINVNTLIRYARAKDYDIYEDSGDYNLNIWAIRSSNSKPGRFDDVEVVFWKHDGEWKVQVYSCTTDPGLHYLLNPLNVNGTAIVKPGQYKGVWRLGHHKGESNHPALVQRKPITVIRDFNKDSILDFNYLHNEFHTHTVRPSGINKVTTYYDCNKKVVHKEETGYMGINNHRASESMLAKVVGRYSAGCIVQNDPKKYYQEFIPTLENAVAIWGDSFSFTMVTEDDIKRTIYES